MVTKADKVLFHSTYILRAYKPTHSIGLSCVISKLTVSRIIRVFTTLVLTLSLYTKHFKNVSDGHHFLFQDIVIILSSGKCLNMWIDCWTQAVGEDPHLGISWYLNRTFGRTSHLALSTDGWTLCFSCITWAGFLNLGIIDILGRINLCCRLSCSL